MVELIRLDGIDILVSSDVQGRHIGVSATTTQELIRQMQQRSPRGRTTKGEEHLSSSLLINSLDAVTLTLLHADEDIDQVHHRHRHHRRDHRHQHQHRIDRRRQDLHLIADTQDDELHQPTRIHEGTEIDAALRAFAREASRDIGATDLPNDSDKSEEPEECPCSRTIDKPQLCLQAARHEEERKEEHQRDVLDLVGENLAEGEILWHDEPEHEGPEEGMHTQQLGDVGGEQEEDEDHPDHTMADDLRIVVHLPRYTEERTDDAKHHQQVGDEEE